MRFDRSFQLFARKMTNVRLLLYSSASGFKNSLLVELGQGGDTAVIILNQLGEEKCKGAEVHLREGKSLMTCIGSAP